MQEKIKKGGVERLFIFWIVSAVYFLITIFLGIGFSPFFLVGFLVVPYLSIRTVMAGNVFYTEEGTNFSLKAIGIPLILLLYFFSNFSNVFNFYDEFGFIFYVPIIFMSIVWYFSISEYIGNHGHSSVKSVSQPEDAGIQVKEFESEEEDIAIPLKSFKHQQPDDNFSVAKMVKKTNAVHKPLVPVKVIIYFLIVVSVFEGFFISVLDNKFEFNSTPVQSPELNSDQTQSLEFNNNYPSDPLNSPIVKEIDETGGINEFGD